MASKIISVSLPETHLWKLEQLAKRTGISKSGLVRRALMYLFTDAPPSWDTPNGLNVDKVIEQLEAEHKEQV